MSPTHKLSSRDLWMLALLTVSWGVNWPVMKIGVADFAPMTFRTLSMAGGIAVLWLIVQVQGNSLRVPREHWGELLRLGFFNMVVWFILAIYGVKLLSSGRAAILGYTLPIWTALWGIVLFGDHPTRRLWIGVSAAAVGVALLLGSEFSHIAGRPLGTVCMLGAAIVWGYGTHLMRRRKQKTSVQVITFWSLTQSVIICTIVAVVLEHDQWTRLPNSAESWAIAYNSIVIFGFSQVMWFRLATILPPVASGLSVMLIPVTGVFAGIWMLGEQPVWQDYAALVSILLAIATVLLPARSTKTPVAQSAKRVG